MTCVAILKIEMVNNVHREVYKESGNKQKSAINNSDKGFANQCVHGLSYAEHSCELFSALCTVRLF